MASFLFGSSEAALFTVNANTGGRHWNFNGNWGLYGEHILRKDGLTIFGTRFGIVYAVDVQKKRSRWQYGISGTGPTGRPVSIGELVVMDMRGTLTAVETRNGRLRWTHPGVIATSNSAADEQQVYLCVEDKNQKSGLLAVTAFDGTKAWHFPFPDIDPIELVPEVQTRWKGYPPAVSRDTALVITPIGEMFAIETASGTERWRRSFPVTGRPNFSTRVLTISDTAYCVGPDTVLHALDVLTGEERWRYEMPFPATE